mmetsp:Transcript_8643/g.27144  ORF Transcript_8643/g.27144 Transcript_8643/m.27144 type:complete len:207 (+) Transcript_8643:687-1307(+)
MAGGAKDVDLGHHHGHVDARGEAVEGEVGGVVAGAVGADLLANLPGEGAVDLADGELVEAVAVHDDGADLVARGDLVVDLLEDLERGGVGGGVGAAELGLLALVEEVGVDGLDAVLGDGGRDRAGDGLARPFEGLLGAHALGLVAAKERLDHAVDAAEEDAALAVDVALVLVGERSLKHERRAERDAPAQRDLRRRPGLVLVHPER